MCEEHPIPKEIDGFQIIEILGEGGMSVVYTAMQEHPRRKVAIKVLRGGQFSPSAAKRFYQEVEILGKLDHPWIAKIYNAGTHDDGTGATPYYVMEHIEDARELTQYLENESPQRREVLKLFTMIASAVEHGHHRGIVHRDLKPGNILINKNGEPKIIDFGVARSLERDTVGEKAVTEAGRLVGTVQFMSPEQVDVNITDIDARCDVYALGAVLYQMLTRRLPRTLEGLPIYEAVRQICQEDPVRPTVYDGTIDQDLEAIIMKSLQTKRENRYETAGAFGRDMLRYLGNRPIKARKATSLDRAKLFVRRHKKQLVVWIGVLFVVAAVMGGINYLQDESSNRLDELQAKVDKLSEEYKGQEDATPPMQTAEVKIVPTMTLPGKPQKIAVSLDGDTVAATLERDYFVSSIEGVSILIPPINIEPTDASLALSRDGSTLGVVSHQRCSIVGLEKPQPPRRFSGRFGDITGLCVGDGEIAIASKDMSMTILGGQKKQRRVNSTTGEYKVIAFSLSGDQIVAATDRWIYVWLMRDFPKNGLKLHGVNNPCAIGVANRRIVTVGRDGQILIHEPPVGSPIRQTMQLDTGHLEQAALNSEANIVGLIAGGRGYRYELETSELEEATWMTATPVGVAVDDDGKLILWTEEGEIFRQR